MSDANSLPAVRNTIPTAEGTPLEGSPHLYTVYSLLCSGWHPVKVALYLAERGEPVSVEVIDAYLKNIADEEMLPTTALTRFFRGLDVISDPVRTMHEMLLLRKASLARKIEAAGDDKWPLAIDLDTKDIFDMAAELKGLLDGPMGGAKPLESTPSRNTPTLREVFASTGKKRITAERITVEDMDDPKPAIEGEFEEVD